MRPWPLALLLGFAGLVSGSAAAAVESTRIDLPSAVAWTRQAGDPAWVGLADGTTHRLENCATRPLCLVEAAPPAPQPAPPGALPDGGIAIAGDGDIRRAWYAAPTRRYAHGVLGDTVEAGALVVAVGESRYEYVLPRTHVFEDLTPRIADLDGDGRNEVVTIRASLPAGASVAVFGLRGDALALLDTAGEIGRANRWLSIAGIGDFTGAGVPVVAWVETPHIGGTLRMAAFEDGALDVFENSYRDFSNHVIGSRDLNLAAQGDFTGDGVPDLAIPSADRRRLVVAARTGFTDIPLAAPVDHPVLVVDRRLLVVADGAGLVLIEP